MRRGDLKFKTLLRIVTGGWKKKISNFLLKEDFFYKPVRYQFRFKIEGHNALFIINYYFCLI